jgi:hypothetical protein
MSEFFGSNNMLLEYFYVILMYGSLFLVMRYANDTVDLNFRKTYWVLYIGWSFAMFGGNYFFYSVNLMSFLPWFNDFIHSFIWIGFCLGFLYAGCYKRPMVEQMFLCAFFSFIVKMTENQVLGTWEKSDFLFFHGSFPYIVSMSLVDGLYPVLSKLGLKVLSKYIDGLVVPE